LGLGEKGLFLLAALWQETVPHSSFFELLLRASPVAKGVLAVLLVFSIISWSIIIAKSISTRRAMRESDEFLQLFARVNASNGRWADLQSASVAANESPLVAIFRGAHEELRSQGRGVLNLESVRRAMQIATVRETTRLEQSMGWLASTASAAPFIGLFGTVVGIIIAFQGLSTATTASIQAVAPGIAEALIATAAGIGAAVPAVLGYNHFLNKIKMLAAEMDNFSLGLLNFIERESVPVKAGRTQEVIPLGQRE
jgi:biopolymer transport protein TolQ